jgi:type I site-specific restriction endonuclease
MSILEKMNMNAADATAIYIKLRDTKKEKDEAHKESLKKLNSAMERLEGALLEFLDSSRLQSSACAAGTVFKAMHTSATVQDKEAFMSFVRETEQWDALDVKANKTFASDYLEENKEPMPGVKMTSIASVGVQRK